MIRKSDRAGALFAAALLYNRKLGLHPEVDSPSSYVTRTELMTDAVREASALCAALDKHCGARERGRRLTKSPTRK